MFSRDGSLNRQDDKAARPSTLPKQGGLFASILLLSALLHISSYISLPPYTGFRKQSESDAESKKQEPLKIKITQNKALDPSKPIVETPMEKTAAPEVASVLGPQDHKTKQEVKLKRDEIKSIKAANAGPKGLPEKATAPTSATAAASNDPVGQKSQISISGSLPIQAAADPRNAYEKFLNTSAAAMQGQIDAGYREYIDGQATEGDHIDLNTQEYRYVGYFTTLRKSIELVWNYPLAAVRKGLQGTVNLEFTIHENGEVTQIKVLKTSGFQVLDKAIVDAIKLASPFAPLPTGFGKKKLVITGAFNYVLS